jgi:hypothetical protein
MMHARVVSEFITYGRARRQDVGLFQSQQKLELTYSPGIASIDFPAILRCFTGGGCEQPSRA